MTIPHASFAALAELAPIGSTTRTWEACRLVYVEGKSQTEAAAATDLHIATVSNAVSKCEATCYRLPALLATVRLAMGDRVTGTPDAREAVEELREMLTDLRSHLEKGLSAQTARYLENRLEQLDEIARSLHG